MHNAALPPSEADERWHVRYNEVRGLEPNHKNLSRYMIEEHDMLTGSSKQEVYECRKPERIMPIKLLLVLKEEN